MQPVTLGHKHSLFPCPPLSPPLSPPPLSLFSACLSLTLSSSWYSHMCNGINTLLGHREERAGQRGEERGEGEAMEEMGEEKEREGQKGEG